MKTYILILYFQKRIELLSSAIEVITMNDHILNMLKADLTVLDKLEIKPNYADLARKYKMDYRTVKKYYESYNGKPENRNCRSKWDPYASDIEEKLSIGRVSHKGVYRILLSKYGKKQVKFCLRIIVFSLANPEF